MSPSISQRFSDECGSAIVGFVAGAPFVLVLFVGFLEVTQVSWKTIIYSTQEKIRLLEVAQGDVELSNQTFMQLNLDEISLIKIKGTHWNLWRIQE